MSEYATKKSETPEKYRQYDKQSDEISQMNMIDDKKSDERDQISKNDEEKKTGDIEVLKLGKLSSQKNIDNIQKYSDESNWMDMSDNNKSGGRDQISKNDEEKVTGDIEVLKLGN